MSIVLPVLSYERAEHMKIYPWLASYGAGAKFTLIVADGGFIALQAAADNRLYVVNDASDAEPVGEALVIALQGLRQVDKALREGSFERAAEAATFALANVKLPTVPQGASS